MPSEIPNSIEIDVSNLGLNDAIYMRDVAAGAKWLPISDPDLMLLHVVTPRAVEEPVADAATAVPVAAGAEPEVIKKGKTDKEDEAAGAKDKKDKK